MAEDVNNIQIYGPKGTGKTNALLRLKELLVDARYIDLAEFSESFDYDDNKFLLINNAQLFTFDIKCATIQKRKVIAAFSPGAKVTDSAKVLTKRCGDGREMHFYWRPCIHI